jgi:hypothetical protein
MSLSVTALADSQQPPSPVASEPSTAQLPALTSRASRDDQRSEVVDPSWAGPTGIVAAVPASRAGDIGMAASAVGRPTGGPSRGLRAAVFMTAAAAIGVAIALVVLGIRPSAPHGAVASASAAPSGPPPGLRPISVSSASLAVGSAPYKIDLLAVAPCWIKVQSGTRVLFAGTLAPGQSHHIQLQGPASVELGSAGGHLVLTFWGHHFNLVPPVAPYSFVFS